MKRTIKYSALSNTISFSVGNAADQDKPVIYAGTPATLTVSLGNLTGGEITLPSGGAIELFMPAYFSNSEVSNMRIDTTQIAGWKFTVSDGALLLTRTGAGKWKAGDNLIFSISNVVTTAAPKSDSVQVNFIGLKGANIPAQVTATLALNAVPLPGNASLQKTLLPELQFNGVVYVSDAANPLINTLYLNIKNTGTSALYSGTESWKGNPRIIVSFVYGNSSGALAPAVKAQSDIIGSAWAISGGMGPDQTGGWTIQNPKVTDQANTPSWILTPISTNEKIIGTGANANVTFAFSNIFSLTTVGATQMYVQFTGFMKDEKTHYDDELFVLSINKSVAPYTAGLVNFFAVPDMNVQTTAMGGRTGDTTVNLKWSAFYSRSVKLQYVITGKSSAVTALTRNYNPSPTVIDDSASLVIPGVKVGDHIDFTMYANDASGKPINSKPFGVVVQLGPPAFDFKITTPEVRYHPQTSEGVASMIITTWGNFIVEITNDSTILGCTLVTDTRELQDLHFSCGTYYSDKGGTVTFTVKFYEAKSKTLVGTFQEKVKFIPV